MVHPPTQSANIGASAFQGEQKYFMFCPALAKTNSLHLNIDLWKRRFLLETTIFRCYVSFRQGKNPKSPTG